MRKTISTLLTVLSVAVLLLTIAFSVYAVIDINCAIKEANSLGIDTPDIDFGYGIVWLGISFLGLVISIVSTIVAKEKVRKTVSAVVIGAFIVLFVCVFGIGAI